MVLPTPTMNGNGGVAAAMMMTWWRVAQCTLWCRVLSLVSDILPRWQ